MGLYVSNASVPVLWGDTPDEGWIAAGTIGANLDDHTGTAPFFRLDGPLRLAALKLGAKSVDWIEPAMWDAIERGDYARIASFEAYRERWRAMGQT